MRPQTCEEARSGVDNGAVPTSNGEDSPELGMALMCYLVLSTTANLIPQVNTFPLDSKVESLAELSDGLVLSKMLGGCRTGHFHLSLLLGHILSFDYYRGLRSQIRGLPPRKRYQFVEMAGQEEGPRKRREVPPPLFTTPLRRLDRSWECYRFQCYCRAQ